jgi:hypothetical protein
MQSGAGTNTFDPSSTPSLVIENPLLGGRVAVPAEIRLEGEVLSWRKSESAPEMEGFRAGEPVDRAIWEFLELRDASASDVLRFAQKYGVLAIRSDGLPATAGERYRTANIYPTPRQDENDPNVWWFEESVPVWRMYSVSLRAVLAFAIALRANPNVAFDSVIREYDLGKYTWDWFGLPIAAQGAASASDEFYIWEAYLSPGFLLQNLARCGPLYAQQWLGNFITSNWLNWGGLMPVINWDKGVARMTLSLGQHGFEWALPNNMLFSVLAAQLAALVTSAEFERLDQCSVCGRIFVPAIKPGRHSRSFCPEHKLEGDRERKRRWARKQAAMKKRMGTIDV